MAGSRGEEGGGGETEALVSWRYEGGNFAAQIPDGKIKVRCKQLPDPRML